MTNLEFVPNQEGLDANPSDQATPVQPRGGYLNLAPHEEYVAKRPEELALLEARSRAYIAAMKRVLQARGEPVPRGLGSPRGPLFPARAKYLPDFPHLSLDLDEGTPLPDYDLPAL